MVTYWAPLIHIYQPPTQEVEVLKKIDKECYKPLFSIIEDHENAKFCLNINGVLIQLFHEYGLSDTMELMKNLVSEDKIEILGTAKFHPILPLIPKKEAHHQIQMNEEINRKEFGRWERKGFFPPEMSISSKVAKYIRDLGYKWVIMSGIACPIEWPYDKIYRSPNGLQLFFRDEILSNKIAFKSISTKEFVKEIKILHKDKKLDYKNNTYIITAMDGETFGHHIPNYEKTFLGKTLEIVHDKEDIEIIFISNLEMYFPIAKETIIPKESSWSTSSEDINAGVPYPLWNHPENIIHKYYWKIMRSMNNLINLADELDLTQDWEIEHYYTTARWFYDRCLYSCPTWWANPEKGIWSPNLIYKGVELIMKAALNAQMALVYAGKSYLGEGYFDSITYYQGLLLMELYNTTKKEIKIKNKTKK
ncbi:MAG: hypothetical protein ACFFA6_09845 [Promethearchaeota archaeon]